MCKPLWAGCVVLAVVLACAGAAPATPEAASQRDAMAVSEVPAPLTIQFQPYATQAAAAADEVAAASTVTATLGSTPVADAPPAAIPLPAGVYVGLVGLASTFAAWRRFKRRRI